MSLRVWLCLYAGVTCATAGLFVSYFFWHPPVPWYWWVGTWGVLGWFSWLTHGMWQRLQVQRILRKMLSQDERH